LRVDLMEIHKIQMKYSIRIYGRNAQKKLLVLEVLVIDAAKAVINFNDVKRTLYNRKRLHLEDFNFSEILS